MPVPTKEEVIKYLQQRKNATYTAIANNFSIKIATVSDLIDDLKRERKVTVIKIGTAKVVNLKK